MPPQITCASALPVKKWGNMKITFFTQLDCVQKNAPVRCLPERKIVICDVYDSI